MLNAELESIQKFLACFNSIEKALQSAIGSSESFSTLVRKFYGGRPRYRMTEKFLKRVSEVRNFLVHETTTPGEAIVVPSESTLSQLERINTELLAPLSSFADLVKPVRTIEIHEPLSKAFIEMKSADVSQLPVFENGEFRGLLTELGLVRFIADMVSSYPGFILEFESTPLRDFEDYFRRDECQWISAGDTMSELQHKFLSSEALIAVLIAKSRGATRLESLNGIVTRWDIGRI
jgi:CBS domain-containing protein